MEGDSGNSVSIFLWTRSGKVLKRLGQPLLTAVYSVDRNSSWDHVLSTDCGIKINPDTHVAAISGISDGKSTTRYGLSDKVDDLICEFHNSSSNSIYRLCTPSYYKILLTVAEKFPDTIIAKRPYKKKKPIKSNQEKQQQIVAPKRTISTRKHPISAPEPFIGRRKRVKSGQQLIIENTTVSEPEGTQINNNNMAPSSPLSNYHPGQYFIEGDDDSDDNIDLKRVKKFEPQDVDYDTQEEEDNGPSESDDVTHLKNGDENSNSSDPDILCEIRNYPENINKIRSPENTNFKSPPPPLLPSPSPQLNKINMDFNSNHSPYPDLNQNRNRNPSKDNPEAEQGDKLGDVEEDERLDKFQHMVATQRGLVRKMYRELSSLPQGFWENSIPQIPTTTHILRYYFSLER